MAAVDELRRAIECPVCYDRLKPPIETCENGHGICQTCRKTLNECGICKKKFAGIIRVHTLLNQVMENLLIRCKFYSEGCTIILNINEISKHEMTCIYRPVKCALCYEEGITFKILNYHIDTHKKEEKYTAFFLKSSKNLLCKKQDDKNLSHVLGIVKCNETCFGVRFKLDWEKKFAWVCVMYIEKPLKQYVYNVTIKEKSADPCLFTCRGTCVPYFHDSKNVALNPKSIHLNLESIFFDNFPPVDGFLLSIEIKSV